jgi:hypothetical protein
MPFRPWWSPEHHLYGLGYRYKRCAHGQDHRSVAATGNGWHRLLEVWRRLHG